MSAAYHGGAAVHNARAVTVGSAIAAPEQRFDLALRCEVLNRW
jgi:hypothetical protein